MELSKLKTRQKHEEGLEIQVKCPETGEPLDFYITIVGPDSKEWRKAQKADVRAYLSQVKGAEFSDEELIDRDIDKLTQITIGWHGLTEDGKEVEFSKDKCKELYTDAPTVMDQIDLAAGQFRNFIKG